MARPKRDVEQIKLFETDNADTRAFKEARSVCQSLDEKAKKLRKQVKEAREACLAVIRDRLKVSPDIAGVIKFIMDGEIVKVTPGESKLSFKTVPVEKPSDEDDDEDDD